jgi:hypothetical protein
MFSTYDRANATAEATKQGFTVEWGADGSMGLRNVAKAAFRTHSDTGDEYWVCGVSLCWAYVATPCSP